MPGLELIGPIAATPKTPAANATERGFEELGMLIMADVLDAPKYSGMNLGSRWLCRLQGPVLELPIDWPNGLTWKYWPDEGGARGMYQALRNHIFQRFPGVEARDDRQHVPLNVPSGLAESFWQNGTEILRLVCDRMTDLQIAVRQTQCVRRFAADPAFPDVGHIINYFTQPDVCYLAVARGPTGAANHVLLVYSPRHQPEPAIPQGMPGAERQKDYSTGPFQIRSGFLTAFWGRISGNDVLAPVRGGDAGAMLHQYLGNRVAAPLQTNVPGLDERLPCPAVWALRVEPGEWRTHYYTLDPRPGEGYSFCCISKTGAPPFQPGVVEAPAEAKPAAQNRLANGAPDYQSEAKNGAPKLVEAARTMTPQQLVEAAKQIFPLTTQKDGTPAWSFDRTLGIMRNPGYQGNPRFQLVQQVTEKIARAHWLCMKPEDRKSEGNEEKYVKGRIADVYEQNGVPVPGIGGFFSKLVDKL